MLLNVTLFLWTPADAAIIALMRSACMLLSGLLPSIWLTCTTTLTRASFGISVNRAPAGSCLASGSVAPVGRLATSLPVRGACCGFSCCPTCRLSCIGGVGWPCGGDEGRHPALAWDGNGGGEGATCSGVDVGEAASGCFAGGGGRNRAPGVGPGVRCSWICPDEDHPEPWPAAPAPPSVTCLPLVSRVVGSGADVAAGSGDVVAVTATTAGPGMLMGGASISSARGGLPVVPKLLV
mmetsp:Transcript_34406/g.97478  ORF Transcript_34406/g.97478 Transcript_34406/m.97478 type:complete len:237 (-) Transcript_34406:912-1622(-)